MASGFLLGGLLPWEGSPPLFFRSFRILREDFPVVQDLLVAQPNVDGSCRPSNSTNLKPRSGQQANRKDCRSGKPFADQG